jgi:thiol:disulfide interchange protein
MMAGFFRVQELDHIPLADGTARRFVTCGGENWSRSTQLSTAFGFVLLGAYIWMVVRLWPPASVEHAWAVGALWFVLTLAFEFLFGRYVLRKSWQHLFHDYNLLAGRVWVLIPLWVAVAPYLFSRLGA